MIAGKPFSVALQAHISSSVRCHAAIYFHMFARNVGVLWHDHIGNESAAVFLLAF